MKSLKDIVSKNDGFVLGKFNPHLELLCNSIQEWIINEFAPEIQNWTIEEFAPEVQNWVDKEFSPQIEKWVKEYMNDKRTTLHISDFCGDDSNHNEEPYIQPQPVGPIKKMGTVEPEWNDEKQAITLAGSIQDNALAFIYGAIKKYGSDPAYYDELKDYIIMETHYIGKNQ